MPGMKTILIFCTLAIRSINASFVVNNNDNASPNKSLRSGGNVVPSTKYLNDEFYIDDFYIDDEQGEQSTDPTVQPSFIPTVAPSMPTPVPSRLPTACPSRVPTYVPTSTRFPTLGGTPPPSAQEGYILSFDQLLPFYGARVSTFSEASRVAITNSVASLMGVNDDAVVYNNDTYELLPDAARSADVLKSVVTNNLPPPTDSTDTIKSDVIVSLSHKEQHDMANIEVSEKSARNSSFSRRLANSTSTERYAVTSELSITVIQVLYPEFQSTPGALYLSLVALLEESIDSGDFYEKVAEQALFLGSDELANLTAANLTSGQFTVLNYTEPAPDGDKKRRLPWWRRFLINNWLWIMLISMGFSCLVFCIARTCCPQKNNDNDETETYYDDDGNSSVASADSSVVSGSSISGSSVSGRSGRGGGGRRGRPSSAAVQALRQSSNRNGYYDDVDYDYDQRGGGRNRNRGQDVYEDDSYRRRGGGSGSGGSGRSPRSGNGRRNDRYAEEEDNLPRPATRTRREPREMRGDNRDSSRGGGDERRGHRRGRSGEQTSSGSYTSYRFTIG